MTTQIAALIQKMMEYDRGDARRIQHFIKVHDFACSIAALEQVDAETQFVLETAAIVHDIGIRNSERKYGSSSGKYQELEGPDEADQLLREIGGYTEEQIARIKYLVGHHHTYAGIDGIDYQILVEADFLVNLFEDSASYQAVEAAKNKIFKTSTGIQFLETMFAPETTAHS